MKKKNFAELLMAVSMAAFMMTACSERTSQTEPDSQTTIAETTEAVKIPETTIAETTEAAKIPETETDAETEEAKEESTKEKESTSSLDDENVSMSDESEYVNIDPSRGVLINVPGYTGLTPVETNNDYHGGYYYKDQTQDGMTVIVNTAFKADLQEGETLEEMILRKLELVEPLEARESAAEENAEQSARLSYPVYYVTWLTGEDDAAVDWTAMVVLTDAYTYIYAYGTNADYADEMNETWYDSFERIELVFLSEEF